MIVNSIIAESACGARRSLQESHALIAHLFKICTFILGRSSRNLPHARYLHLQFLKQTHAHASLNSARATATMSMAWRQTSARAWFTAKATSSNMHWIGMLCIALPHRTLT
eukprot:jgi/Ulvmu1/9047/UM005_0140.1